MSGGIFYPWVTGTFPAGSAANPSITFTLDPDTGLFNPAPNNIGVTVGGAEIGRWNSTGLGIGTTSPTYRLHVEKTNTATSGTDTASYSNMTATGTGTNSGNYYGFWGRVVTSGTGNFTGALRGFIGTTTIAGTGSVSSVMGGFMQVIINKTAGTVTNAYGANVAIANVNTGGITNAYSFYASAPSGTITTSTGLFLDNHTIAITTNNGNVIFNEGGDANTDFRVEGDTNTHLLFTDAGVDQVAIGTSTVVGKLTVSQASTTAAIPVISLNQADVSEEFMELLGTSAAANLTQSLVRTASVGASVIAAWAKIVVTDTSGSTSGTYYMPLYTLS